MKKEKMVNILSDLILQSQDRSNKTKSEYDEGRAAGLKLALTVLSDLWHNDRGAGI